MIQDHGLVLICYCVCAVAVYALLDLGERSGSQELRRRRRKWILAATVAAGSGLWVAALVGTRAFAWWPIGGYGFSGAFWSWLGAFGVSLAALYLIAVRPRTKMQLAATLAVMASSMAALYEGGVSALSTVPAVVHPALPTAGALLLAVAASSLVLGVCTGLRRYRGSNRQALQLAAALLLAGALCAVQFVFIHAAQLAPQSAALAGFIPVAWAGTILAPVAAGVIVVVMLLSRMEAQAVTERRERERQRQAEESIRRVTYFDAVTGLPNRGQFNEALVKQLISVNGRSPPPFGLLHAEIRNYAALLEQLGQERLNKVLARVAQQLGISTDAGDLLARLSHDRFAFLLRRREPEQVQAALDAIVAALSAPLRDEDEGIELAWSLGSSHYPAGGDSARALVRAAMQPQREFVGGHGSGASLLLA
jgi:diguanylate cyclase (GGDEF)-like protein